MKIEPFPWLEGYLIDMDELYTELTLEEIERKLLGEESRKLSGYQEMFNCHKPELKNRKVLMKADPGMGKTTLGKKVTRDWATGIFKKFSVVFFVALKFVKPGDTIEKTVMQQHPELEGLQISQQKLKALLNRYSNRILIILDGLDEHGLGQNEDVLKMIKNQKLLGCGILVSSRPHSVNEVEQHFPTIVKVEGFTKEEASKFVSKHFDDQNKIIQILEFKPSDSREDFPVHKCPILLSFLCLLAREDEIDLLDRNLAIGDLYLRMIQCLYKKFTIRKNVPFESREFLQVLKSVGQLALQTLKENNLLLQRSEVLRIAGEFAFEYGFFAGHQDFKIYTDPTADIYVMYAHRSIEEFFGSFGFLQALDEGKTVEETLGSDCEKPIFMVNPLVLTFCLWLLTKDFFASRRVVCDKLVTYVAQRIDYYMLDSDSIGKMYPAINIDEAAANKNSLKLEFFRRVFKRCEHRRVLCLRSELESVHGLISHSLLNKLTLLSLGTGYLPSELAGISRKCDDLTISIETGLERNRQDLKLTLQALQFLVAKCDLRRNRQVRVAITYGDSLDLRTLMQMHIKQLHLKMLSSQNDSPRTIFISGEFPFCPCFTQFAVENCTIDDSVPSAFMRAVKDGKLPNLKRIMLRHCTLNDCEWPEVPQFSLKHCHTPHMQKLITKVTELQTSKFESLHQLCVDHLLPVRLDNLLSLELELQHAKYLNNMLKQGILPNLSALRVLYNTGGIVHCDTVLEEIDLNHAVNLKQLGFVSFEIITNKIEMLSQRLTSVQLTELDMSGSSGLSGKVSKFFTHIFPSLRILILVSCSLNPDDLMALSQVNVECK